MEITYVKLPLASIPFDQIPSLQNFEYNYVYCSYFSIKEFHGLDYNLMSVYDNFEKLEGAGNIDNKELLFGRVVCEVPTRRGKEKVIKIDVVHETIRKDSLPHLKYSNNYMPSGNWFYTKEGNYFIFKSIESSYEKVRHLEGISIYGDNLLRLRIVIELLKRNVRAGILTLSDADFMEIGFRVLRAEPLTKRLSDAEILNGVNNWVLEMVRIPIYDEIPNEYKERVKDI